MRHVIVGIGAILLLACAHAIDLNHLVDRASDIEEWIISVRRELHQIPELMFNEYNTSAAIRKHLDALNIPYVHPIAKTGIVATLGHGTPTVALRADIDALPITEDSGVEFPSRNPGTMHACGHDGHVSMLLGAARILKNMEGSLPGTVKLVFQPAEEGGAGGDVMVKEGALDGVSAAFGLHVWPALPSGVVGTRPGVIMAGSIEFKVKIRGAGGHAAMPHLTTDPVVAAASAVIALQTLVARGTSPFASAVVSVTKMWAGGVAFNVIPDEAHFGGTIRATSDEHVQTLRQRLQQVVTSQAASFGCTAEVDWMLDRHPYYPPVVNHPDAAAFLSDVAGQLLGTDAVVRDVEATMAGEDFAFFTRKVPSAFAFLGIRNETLGSVHGLHTARFTLDESALKIGAALHAALATQYLEDSRRGSATGTWSGSGASSGWEAVAAKDEL